MSPLIAHISYARLAGNQLKMTYFMPFSLLALNIAARLFSLLELFLEDVSRSLDNPITPDPTEPAAKQACTTDKRKIDDFHDHLPVKSVPPKKMKKLKRPKANAIDEIFGDL